jgi:hypothetical protein
VHTDALRGDELVEVRLAAARRDGYDTAAAHETRRNPWDGNAGTAVERMLAVFWAKGFSAAVDAAIAGTTSSSKVTGE